MCDYSLHAAASRPARTGDKLVISRFPYTFTRGFAAVDESNVAGRSAISGSRSIFATADCSLATIVGDIPAVWFGPLADSCSAAIRHLDIMSLHKGAKSGDGFADD
jgi:hypothetical protein